MNEFLIKAENISYRYDGEDPNKSPVLNELSLDIREGEFVAILGHNGSGKSTLAKLLNMILIPVTGKIYVLGKDVTDENITDEDILSLRKDVGMVFQNPDNQLVATIVEDDVAFGPENLGLPSEEIRNRVDKVLKGVGMYEYAKHEPHRLSGGQKQRIAIAGVLAMEPKCIIFDESTAMLDPVGRRDVMNAIIELNREKGITVIMITHYMEEVIDADRVLVINDGEIFAQGTPTQIFQREKELKSIGLELPLASYIAQKLQKAGFEIPDGILTESQLAEALCKL